VNDGTESSLVASGTLGETPFSHLMLYLYRREQSGTLVITDPTGVESRVRIHHGRAIMAQLTAPASDMASGLAPLCSLPDGQFAFYAQALLERPTIAGQLDPYEMMGAAFHGGHLRDDMAKEVVERFGDTPLRLKPGRELQRLKLRRDVTPLLDLIRAAPATASELLAQSPLSAAMTRRLLYLLIVTHMLAPYTDRKGEAYQSQAIDPALLRGDGAAQPGAGTINEVASGGAGAWQRLASATTSLAPGARRSLGPPAPAPSADPIGDALREADKLVRQGKHADALALLEPLVQDNAEHVGLRATKAWVIYDRDGRGKASLPDHVITAIDAAFKLDKEYPLSVYLRGLQRKHEGNMERASRLFKKAVQLDPKNLDAQRELRLARMRMR
jgi:tetratricopeptide (TPR) repeat protein